MEPERRRSRPYVLKPIEFDMATVVLDVALWKGDNRTFSCREVWLPRDRNRSERAEHPGRDRRGCGTRYQRLGRVSSCGCRSVTVRCRLVRRHPLRMRLLYLSKRGRVPDVKRSLVLRVLNVERSSCDEPDGHFTEER
jgi:hypothetical protein